ncbi:MAG TPA: SPFH domain-containing protein [Alphaproteobacteria bacterium]|nr:paraslipin [Rhodospirillaceae bacterium]HRJ12208.1 SPFH domain-containing protein [Alphaproteobacteria bacterium]
MELGILTIILLIFGVYLVFASVKTVPQSQSWLVEQFGKYTKTLTPGLHLIVPFIERVSYKISMQEIVLDVPSQQVITKDNTQVTADGVVYYQVINAPAAAYEVQNLKYAIINLAQTNLRTVIGSMDLDEVLSKRDYINERLLQVVDAATSPWGVKVTRIEIKDLSPPQNIIDSMARQMKAEREKRAEILSAEGERQGAILRAEGQKQSAILQAEGRKESAFRDAEAREREAQAEAAATQMVSQAIASGNVNALNYFIGQKYVEALRDIASAPNQKVIMMPLEAAGVMGSIAGVTEMIKEGVSKNKAA